MDIFDEEIINFWKSLADNNVQYIMVGDYASSLHGHQRFTGGIDIWLKDTLENRRQLRNAFNKLRYGRLSDG